MLYSGSKKKRNREINPFADPSKSNPVAFSRSIRGYRGLSTTTTQQQHLNNNIIMKEARGKWGKYAYLKIKVPEARTAFKDDFF